MEKLEIIISKESYLTKKEFAEFIKQFNLLKNEEVKNQIVKLVRGLLKVQSK